jgi:protein arginine N-methyltransferase 1
MYTIHDYGEMIADRGRVDAYTCAIARAVSSESVVLDLGAGTGAMAIAACRAGARRIYAVESDAVIEVARQTVVEQGFSDRVVFMNDRSTRIDLPEPVDVIVADLHGALPWFADSVAALLDARDRFLKPSGVMIPERDTVWGAAVCAPQEFARVAGPWEAPLGFASRFGRQRALNTLCLRWFSPDELVVSPQRCMAIEYRTAASPIASGRLQWDVAAPIRAHGLALWFDCETAPGCRFSNSPVSGERHVFGQVFAPWIAPVDLEANDELTATVRVDLVAHSYLWSWRTAVRRNGAPVIAFDQSEFLSVPLSAEWTKKAHASYVPSPNAAAAIDRAILDMMFSGLNLGEIADRVAAKFPQQFPDAQAALTRVAELSMRYSS